MHDTVKILNDRFGCNMDPEKVVEDRRITFQPYRQIKPYEPVVISQNPVKKV